MHERQYEVVRDTGRALRTILRPAIEEEFGEAEYTAGLPDARPDSGRVVSIFLWDVGPDPEFQLSSSSDRDIYRTTDEDGNTVEVRPGRPLYLRLRYMLSVWSADVEEEQAMLGVVLRTFHDTPYIGAEHDEAGTLAAEREGPRIEMDEALDLETQSRIWGDARPFKPVVGYNVRARLESEEREVIRRVRERVIDYNKIE